MTTRNTKGRTAAKKATKKAVKKPTEPVYVAKSLEENFAAFVVKSFGGLTDKLEQVQRDVDQIQRDIEQVRTLAYQTRTNSRANTVILNKTLAGVDLLKSGSSFMQEVKQHKAAPEEPKAEPWEPKAGMHVVFLDDTWQAGVHKGTIEVESGPDCDGHWKTIASKDYGGGIYFADGHARPATPEEIAQAEGEEKLKKLVRGCRVETPDGEGIYLGCSQYDDAYHIFLLDTASPRDYNRYTIDQLTPLT